MKQITHRARSASPPTTQVSLKTNVAVALADINMSLFLHQAEPGTQVEETEEFRELRRWAEEQGVTWPKVRYPVRFEPGYIGAQATEHIGPNEDIVVVPYNLLLNSEVARRPPLEDVFSAHPEVFANEDLEGEDLVLISFVLGELHKGRESFWYYLINSLPRNAENLCDWSEAEMEELQDEDLVYQTRLRYEVIVKHWEVLEPVLSRYPHFFPQNDATFQNFYWIWQNLTTRAFGKYAPSSAFGALADTLNHEYSHTYYVIGAPGEKQHYTPSLVCLDSEVEVENVWPVSYQTISQIVAPSIPGNRSTKLELLDIKAHEKDNWKARYCRFHIAQENQWGGPFTPTDTHRKLFRMTTGGDEEYEAGAQLYLFYGQYSNRQLLLYYGFTLAKNMYNYVVIKLTLADLCGSQDTAERVPEELRQRVLIFQLREFMIGTELLDVLRMLRWEQKRHAVNAFFHPEDFGLELEVVNAAYMLLEAELAKQRSSIEADLESLKNVRGTRHYFAVRSPIDHLQTLC